MIRINLLPEYRRKSEFPTWKLYRIIAYVFLGLSILLWGYHLAMFKYTESKLSDVNEGIVSMKVWQERFDKAQQQNAEVNKLSYAIFLKTASYGAVPLLNWAMLHPTAAG